VCTVSKVTAWGGLTIQIGLSFENYPKTPTAPKPNRSEEARELGEDDGSGGGDGDRGGDEDGGDGDGRR